MDDYGWSEHVREQERMNYIACVTTAALNGHTPERAENCEDGDVGCPDCPFRRCVLNRG